MALNYLTQEKGTLVGTKTGTTRTAVALTDAYDVAANTKAIPTGGFSQIVVDVLYTTGASETNNTSDIRVEVSQDGTNFYRIVNETVSAGTSSLAAREFQFTGASAETAYAYSVPLDVMYKFMKFSFKEGGVSANYGTVYAEYTLSGR